jgi:hypothetical protein
MEKIKKLSNQLERDIAFMKWRWVGNLVIVLALVAGIVVISGRDNYLIIDKQGNVYTGKNADAGSNESLLIEGDAHMRFFYGTFLTFDHTNVDGQVAKGLELGGKAVEELYSKNRDAGWYVKMKSEGFYVVSTIDSVSAVQYAKDRVAFNVHGKMHLMNDKIDETRRMDMWVELARVERRLGKNPNGFSIERILRINNDIIN